MKQGTKILLTGRVENNNYTNKDGQKVYSVQVITEEIEFAESKNAKNGEGVHQAGAPAKSRIDDDGFMNIPDGLEEE